MPSATPIVFWPCVPSSVPHEPAVPHPHNEPAGGGARSHPPSSDAAGQRWMAPRNGMAPVDGPQAVLIPIGGPVPLASTRAPGRARAARASSPCASLPADPAPAGCARRPSRDPNNALAAGQPRRRTACAWRTRRPSPRARERTGSGDHDRRTREIKQEIAQTREEMSETIEAIQERLSPSNIVSHASETVRDASAAHVARCSIS